MVDIWGRSKRKETSGEKITDEIKKMIKDEIVNNFNLASVEPNEIVVFQDKQGKLKTSDILLDSLLIKNPTAKDDSIAVFKSGKLEPSYDIKRFSDKFDTIDNINVNTTNAVKNLAMLQSAYDGHVANFAQLRRNFNITDNVIEKFFGKKNIKPDEVTTTLADINTAQQKFSDDITAINSRLGVIRDTKSISDLIAINKKSIDDIKKVTDVNSITTIKQTIDKVKIPHDVKDVKGISYVIRQELNKEYLNEHRLSWKETITGIYRFSIISEHQFNIEVSLLDDNNKVSYITQKLNTVLLIIENETVARLSFFIKAVDANVVRAKFGYIFEYVSAI